MKKIFRDKELMLFKMNNTSNENKISKKLEKQLRKMMKA